jgi:beta-ureidopropionase / N-carbamoyl-L-amino-acid hydrolase
MGKTARVVGFRGFALALCGLFMLGRAAAWDLPDGEGISAARFAEADPRGFHVRAARLRVTLEKLSEFGRTPEGGVTRLGYSDTELAAREYVSGLMKEAGLEVRADAAGNLFGRRAGSADLPVLLFGSHIDSVVGGGRFDGDVGSLGAIEVMNALRESGVKTRHPLEVVIWMNEEGNHFGISTMGSGIAAGLLGPEILERKDEQGQSVADWLRRYGQDPARLADARIARGALAGYLELHIEQGPNLEEAKIPIGVVQGIVGLKRWRCVTTGFANHAGTTPMDRRKDALAAAAREVLAVREVVRGEAGRQVGTVGYVKVTPGVVNVIPGRVEFPVELRDLEEGKIDRLWEHIQEKMKQIDAEEKVETSCTAIDDILPARTDPAMQSAIRDAAKSLGLATLDLPSGAVHDAQQMAKLAPFGMIFVPSHEGISHSPKELSSWEDVANGAEVLYRSVLLADEELDRK